jgi:hypothetical protein
MKETILTEYELSGLESIKESSSSFSFFMCPVEAISAGLKLDSLGLARINGNRIHITSKGVEYLKAAPKNTASNKRNGGSQPRLLKSKEEKCEA